MIRSMNRNHLLRRPLLTELRSPLPANTARCMADLAPRPPSTPTSPPFPPPSDDGGTQNVAGFTWEIRSRTDLHLSAFAKDLVKMSARCRSDST